MPTKKEMAAELERLTRMAEGIPTPILLSVLYNRDDQTIVNEICDRRWNTGMYLADERDRIGALMERMGPLVVKIAEKQFAEGINSDGYKKQELIQMQKRGLKRIQDGLDFAYKNI
ncbi:hypothetical protein [Oricola indica]|uniref:hypothetical protein n=1 Tax=Oricola indica TaxID=2872591 RepID=UPI003CCC433E